MPYLPRRMSEVRLCGLTQRPSPILTCPPPRQREVTTPAHGDCDTNDGIHGSQLQCAADSWVNRTGQNLSCLVLPSRPCLDWPHFFPPLPPFRFSLPPFRVCHCCFIMAGHAGLLAVIPSSHMLLAALRETVDSFHLPRHSVR